MHTMDILKTCLNFWVETHTLRSENIRFAPRNSIPRGSLWIKSRPGKKQKTALFKFEKPKNYQKSKRINNLIEHSE